MSDNAFDAWYSGMIGFHINSERILEDLEREVDVGAIQPERLERWMRVCWNNALEAALEQIKDDGLLNWDDLIVPGKAIVALEMLKATP